MKSDEIDSCRLDSNDFDIPYFIRDPQEKAHDERLTQEREKERQRQHRRLDHSISDWHAAQRVETCTLPQALAMMDLYEQKVQLNIECAHWSKATENYERIIQVGEVVFERYPDADKLVDILAIAYGRIGDYNEQNLEKWIDSCKRFLLFREEKYRRSDQSFAEKRRLVWAYTWLVLQFRKKIFLATTIPYLIALKNLWETWHQETPNIFKGIINETFIPFELSKAYQLQGDLESALAYAKETVQIAGLEECTLEKLSNRSVDPLLWWSQIGEVYLDMEKYKEALRWYEPMVPVRRALHLKNYKSAHSAKILASVVGTVASLNEKLERYKDAIIYYQQLLELSRIEILESYCTYRDYFSIKPPWKQLTRCSLLDKNYPYYFWILGQRLKYQFARRAHIKERRKSSSWEFF